MSGGYMSAWLPPSEPPIRESWFRLWGVRLWRFAGSDFIIIFLLGSDIVGLKQFYDLFAFSTYLTWQFWAIISGIFVWRVTYNNLSRRWGIKKKDIVEEQVPIAFNRFGRWRLSEKILLVSIK